MKTLIVSGAGPSKQGTRSPIELSWTAKNTQIFPPYQQSVTFLVSKPVSKPKCQSQECDIFGFETGFETKMSFSGPHPQNNLCPPNPNSPQLVSPRTSRQCIQQAGSPVGDNVFDRTYKSLSDMLCVEFAQTDFF